MDFGRSDDPRVQAQLDRLGSLSVPQGRLGLETIRALMERLGNPHRKLPPVFHVAGTNGKGSTCAFLRAMLEAEGYRVHVTTSPHLVRYNERIRLAGRLIEDGPLADLLEEVLDAGEDLGPSFFEVTIAAAFLAFSRTPADACVVEVGLGGRFDATNVLEPEVLAACGIAALGIDHERFLLAPEDGVPTEPMARIAFEKAGIAKMGVPLVTFDYFGDEAADTIQAVAKKKGAPLFMQNWGDWPWTVDQHQSDRIAYSDFRGPRGTRERMRLPAPALKGRHQIDNAGLAVAILRHQDQLSVSKEAIDRGLEGAVWPARMQRLSPGPLTGSREVWLDGGHNPNAAHEMWMFMVNHVVIPSMKPFHLIIGMLENKDAAQFLNRNDRMFSEILASVSVVPVPDHESHPASAFGPEAVARADLEEAMLDVPDDGYPVLIAGSLYLAGEALRLNDELPD